MKKRHTYLLTLITIFSFVACEKNVEEPDTDTIDCSEIVSYIETIKPVITNNCLGCHNGNQSPNLSTYENVKENASRIKEETFSRRMPKNSTITTAEIEAIYCWVENGALNN